MSRFPPSSIAISEPDDIIYFTSPQLSPATHNNNISFGSGEISLKNSTNSQLNSQQYEQHQKLENNDPPLEFVEIDSGSGHRLTSSRIQKFHVDMALDQRKLFNNFNTSKNHSSSSFSDSLYYINSKVDPSQQNMTSSLSSHNNAFSASDPLESTTISKNRSFRSPLLPDLLSRPGSSLYFTQRQSTYPPKTAPSLTHYDLAFPTNSTTIIPQHSIQSSLPKNTPKSSSEIFFSTTQVQESNQNQNPVLPKKTNNITSQGTTQLLQDDTLSQEDHLALQELFRGAEMLKVNRRSHIERRYFRVVLSPVPQLQWAVDAHSHFLSSINLNDICSIASGPPSVQSLPSYHDTRQIGTCLHIRTRHSMLEIIANNSTQCKQWQIGLILVCKPNMV